MRTVVDNIRKEMWHLIWDLVFFISSLIMAFMWEQDGYSREAFLLLAVSYWGMPWSNQRGTRIRTEDK